MKIFGKSGSTANDKLAKEELTELESGQEYHPRTEFGRKLLEIRKKAEAAGYKFLSDEEMEQEIYLRKGRSE